MKKFFLHSIAFLFKNYFSMIGLRLAFFCMLISLKAAAQKTDSSFYTYSERITYSVDNPLLYKLAGGCAKVDLNPKYSGGVHMLKAFFSLHPLADTVAKNFIFMVHIGFVVNCKGQCGNFQILSNGKGILRQLAQEVLDIVESMPAEWQPALVKGSPVDCFEALSFIIRDGALDNLSYR